MDTTIYRKYLKKYFFQRKYEKPTLKISILSDKIEEIFPDCQNGPNSIIHDLKCGLDSYSK